MYFLLFTHKETNQLANKPPVETLGILDKNLGQSWISCLILAKILTKKSKTYKIVPEHSRHPKILVDGFKKTED